MSLLMHQADQYREQMYPRNEGLILIALALIMLTLSSFFPVHNSRDYVNGRLRQVILSLSVPLSG